MVLAFEEIEKQNMNKPYILIIGLSLCFLTSCLNMTEVLTLNKDGSGVYSLVFDMSDILEDEFSKNMLSQMLAEEMNLEINPEENWNFDTLLYFRDMPDVDRRKMENQAFWNRVSLDVNVSEVDSQLVFKLLLPFTELSDIDYFYENINNLNKQGNLGDANFLISKALFGLKKKKLTRLPIATASNMLEGEEIEFAKTFFANSSYTCIYNLPGKVKKTTIPDAKIEGNSVIQTLSYLDILEDKVKMDGEIKFK